MSYGFSRVLGNGDLNENMFFGVNERIPLESRLNPPLPNKYNHQLSARAQYLQHIINPTPVLIHPSTSKPMNPTPQLIPKTTAYIRGDKFTGLPESGTGSSFINPGGPGASTPLYSLLSGPDNSFGGVIN